MTAGPNGKRRVAITGIGVVSPLGSQIEAFWDSLAKGRSGVRTLVSIPPTALPTRFGAEAWDFSGEIGDFGDLAPEQKKPIRKGLKVMCRECQMGVAAAQQAMADSQWNQMQVAPERVGIVFGSDYMLTAPEEFAASVDMCTTDGEFQFEQWGDQGLSKMSPLWLLKYLPNMPACHVAIYNDLRGPNNSLTLREASANAAIGEAYRTITRGAADVMVAGATGTRIHPMKTVHAAQTEELASGDIEPTDACRPFDLDRQGTVLGEGAGAVVLEGLERARVRGATIYGEILAASSSSVSDRRRVAQRDRALRNVMVASLREAGLRAGEIGHINAHGMGSRGVDRDEAAAIAEVFGDGAARVSVTAPKSYFGNLGAGSGAVELVASLLAMRHGRLFRTLNYKTPDPECPISVVREEGVSPGSSFVNLNVTPQGQASCVLVRAVDAA
jgi:3-oxoacyl-[acyl-carrier-protein] synthase II